MRLEEMRREQAALALDWWAGQTRRDFCKWPRNPFGWPLDAAQLDSWWLACQENGLQRLFCPKIGCILGSFCWTPPAVDRDWELP